MQPALRSCNLHAIAFYRYSWCWWIFIPEINRSVVLSLKRKWLTSTVNQARQINWSLANFADLLNVTTLITQLSKRTLTSFNAKFRVWLCSLSPKYILSETFFTRYGHRWHGRRYHSQTLICFLNFCAKIRAFSCGLMTMCQKVVAFVFVEILLMLLEGRKLPRRRYEMSCYKIFIGFSTAADDRHTT